MSQIARQLCEEIVESPLDISKQKVYQLYSPHQQIPLPLPSNKRYDKTAHIAVVSKKKDVKLSRTDVDRNRAKLKSIEAFNNSLKERACNTLVTGPLRCDNHSVTLVRKRDNKCACKCCGIKRTPTDGPAKLIQAFDSKLFRTSDKACAQVLETASCGTQFLDKKIFSNPHNNSRYVLKDIKPIREMQHLYHNSLPAHDDIDYKSELKQIYMRHDESKEAEMRHYINSRQDDARSMLSKSKNRESASTEPRNGQYSNTAYVPDFRNTPSSSTSKSATLNYMGARRWALSQYYPRRGPDF